MQPHSSRLPSTEELVQSLQSVLDVYSQHLKHHTEASREQLLVSHKDQLISTKSQFECLRQGNSTTAIEQRVLNERIKMEEEHTLKLEEAMKGQKAWQHARKIWKKMGQKRHELETELQFMKSELKKVKSRGEGLTQELQELEKNSKNNYEVSPNATCNQSFIKKRKLSADISGNLTNPKKQTIGRASDPTMGLDAITSSFLAKGTKGALLALTGAKWHKQTIKEKQSLSGLERNNRYPFHTLAVNQSQNQLLKATNSDNQTSQASEKASILKSRMLQTLSSGYLPKYTMPSGFRNSSETMTFSSSSNQKNEHSKISSELGLHQPTVNQNGDYGSQTSQQLNKRHPNSLSDQNISLSQTPIATWADWTSPSNEKASFGEYKPFSIVSRLSTAERQQQIRLQNRIDQLREFLGDIKSAFDGRLSGVSTPSRLNSEKPTIKSQLEKRVLTILSQNQHQTELEGESQAVSEEGYLALLEGTRQHELVPAAIIDEILHKQSTRQRAKMMEQFLKDEEFKGLLYDAMFKSSVQI